MAILKAKDLKELSRNVALNVFFNGQEPVEGEPSYDQKIKDLNNFSKKIATTIDAMARGTPQGAAFAKGFGSDVQDNIKSAVTDAAGYYYNPRGYLDRQLGALGTDNEALTDEQLQQKLDILQQLNTENRGPISGYSVSGGQSRVSVGPTGVGQEQFPTNPNYAVAVPQDTKAQRDEIQQLLEARLGRRASQAELDQFISTLPQELARGREQFLSGEVDRANQYFNQNLAPEIKQGLNARGMLFSGDLQSELARGASDLYAPIQSKEADLANQDDLYFQNAAYQATLRKEVEAGADLTGRLNFEREQARQNQENAFQRTQTDLTNQFNEAQFARQQQRALDQQRMTLEQQKRQSDSAAKTELIGNIAQQVGGLAGTVASSKLANKTVLSGVTT